MSEITLQNWANGRTSYTLIDRSKLSSVEFLCYHNEGIFPCSAFYVNNRGFYLNVKAIINGRFYSATKQLKKGKKLPSDAGMKIHASKLIQAILDKSKEIQP